MLSFLKRVTRLLMLLVFMSVFGVGKVRAQSITPAQDGTGTNVTTDGNIHNINGGSLSGDGANLFHSFEQFGLSQGEVANFLANPNIENILGRIGGGNPSIINGLIQVTGGNANLFLMNPAGFVFGNSAGLDVPGSFTATTANGIQFGGGWFSAAGANDYQALVGNPIGFGFGMAQPGGIVNQGKLAVGEGQNLSLVGGVVVNTGELKAPGGGVVVSAVAGENLVRLSIPGNVLSLEVEPLGGSQPNGWNLPITALPDLLTVGASGVRGNPDGTVEVAGVRVPGDAGTAIVSGKVDVSGETGGTVGVFGDKVAVVGAEIDASGVNGEGRVLVGGDYQGKGSVPNAQRTLVDGGSVINADAGVNGDGGRVIVWADEATRFDGSISARGGSVSGNGGFVEVSGKENLQFTGTVDTSAPFGEVGNLLLDPKNILIQAGGSTPATGQFFSANPAATSTISGTNLSTAINNANVTLQANNDITIDDNVTGTTAGNGLTLQAGRSITFNSNRIINLAGGNFNARINDENAISANRDGGTAQFFMNPGSQIFTNGGDVTINHGTFGGVSVGEVRLEGGQINSGTGNIEITGKGRDGGSINIGILLNSGSVVESSGSGTITLNGTGGNGTNNNHGIQINNASIVESTGTGNITLNGAGGTGTDFNIGIVTFNNSSVRNTGLRSRDGNIFLNGIGQGTGIGNHGILLSQINSLGIVGSLVESTGTGSITLQGTSGSGTNQNNGVITFESSIRSINGNIGVTGISNGTGLLNIGINLLNDTRVESIGTGNITIEGTGAVNAEAIFLDDSSINQTGTGSSSISLIGDEINVSGTSQIKGSANLLLQPLNPNLEITVGGTINDNNNQFNLSTSEINALGSDFTEITIGRADGTGTITIDPTGVNFNDPVTLRSPNSGGAIVVNGQIQTNSNPLTLSAGNTVDVNANIITAGGDININSGGIIDTTGGTLNSSSSSKGGAINLTATNGNITTGDVLSFSRLSGNTTAGNGGGITIKAGGDINGGILNSSSTVVLGDGNTGNGGTTSLEAGGKIQVTEVDARSQIIASSQASNRTAGDGGEITLKAGSDITIIDRLLSFSRIGIIDGDGTAGNGGAITLTAGGNINIPGANLGGTSQPIYSESRVSGNGNAGNGGAITLTAEGGITINGVNGDILGANAIRAGSVVGGDGTASSGGAIKFETKSGDINIDLLEGVIESSAVVIGEGTGGNGGTITFNSAGEINLANPVISATGVGKGTAGNGGAITFTASGDITTGADTNISGVTLYGVDSRALSGGSGGSISVTSKNSSINTSAGTINSSSTSATGGEISLSAPENTTIGNIATTKNNVNLNSPVTLNNDTSIDIGGTGGTVNFNNTVNGNSNLTVNSGAGDINFNSQVGNNQPLGNIQANSTGTTRLNSPVQANSITTDSGGETQINGNITTTGTNGQNYNDNVRIDDNVTLDSNNNPITVNGTVNSQPGETNNLTANAGTSNITITGEVGNNQPLGNIQANSTGTTRLNSPVQATSITTDTGGETQINSNITTTGSNGQNYNDNLRIDDNVTLDSNNNPININGTVNSQTGENNNLNINSGSSTTTLNGDAGNTTPLGDININSTNNITTPNLTANNINLTSGNNITTGNLSTNSTTGNSGSVNLTASGDINTNNINTNSTTGNGGEVNITATGNTNTADINTNSTSGNGGAVNITATGNTNTANINTNSITGNGGEIAIQGTNVTTGNLDSSGNSGGNTSIQATTSIKAGTINSSGTSGNGGNVTLDPDNDIEVTSINAQGGANGVGGNVDITTDQNFRATGTFTDQNGTNASISTAGGQSGGSVTIRHGGGSQNIPFVVGDATTNGTAGAITTGSNNTIAPVQSFPGSYSQGTPPSEIQIITQDSPSNETDETKDFEQPKPQLPQPTILRLEAEQIVGELEEGFTREVEGYYGREGETPIKTLDQIKNELLQVENQTGVKPSIIYAFFFSKDISDEELKKLEKRIEGEEKNKDAVSTPDEKLEWQFSSEGAATEFSTIKRFLPKENDDADKLVLLMVTGKNKPILKRVPGGTRERVVKEADDLQIEAGTSSANKWRKHSNTLYNWLVQPLEEALSNQEITNIAFVMDVKLRSTPLATLQNSQSADVSFMPIATLTDNQGKFIIEKYSVGLMPSMSLTDTRYRSVRNSQVLVMGRDDFSSAEAGLSQLPGVRTEIDFITKLWSSVLFFPQGFSIKNLEKQKGFDIIHLATHAKFTGSPNDSYIQFGENEKLILQDIRNKLKWTSYKPPVELLVLSACQTAVGNKEAELGFAGFANQAGVKSVLASLLSVPDEGTVGLMTQFYQQLKKAPIKAEALRQAQLAMMQGKVYTQNGRLFGEGLPPEGIELYDSLAQKNNRKLEHPYYWSWFTIVGSPW